MKLIKKILIISILLNINALLAHIPVVEDLIIQGRSQYSVGKLHESRNSFSPMSLIIQRLLPLLTLLTKIFQAANPPPAVTQKTLCLMKLPHPGVVLNPLSLTLLPALSTI